MIAARRACIAGLAVVGVAVTASPADPEPPLRWEGERLQGVPVSSDLYRPRFQDGSGAWESWEYTFRFPNGYVLIAQVQVSNLGFASQRGLMVGLILAPDGRSALIKNGRPRGEWSAETQSESCTLRIAKHVVIMTPTSHRLSLENSRGAFTVEAEALTPALRPGRVALGDEKFYDLTVLAPRLTARGTARFPGEAVVTLEGGTGVALKASGNVADHKLAGSQFRLHTFDHELQVSMVELTTTKKHGHQRLGLFWAVRRSQIVAAVSDFERRFVSLRPDSEGPRYPVPASVRFAAGPPRQRLSGDAGLGVRRRDDLLDWVDSPIVRFLVGRLSHPVQYVFDADYSLELDAGGGVERVSGSGLAALSILDQPPSDHPW